MIKVCSLSRRALKNKECWSFPNDKLNNALAFARIGSQHGRVRRVTLCGRLVRVYSDGVKVSGSSSMTSLRKKARACR